MKVYGLTDVGRRRDNNQDQFVVDDAMGLYAIADGMGGHAAGEVASKIAIDALADTLRNNGAQSDSTEAIGDQLVRAVNEGNRRICESVLARQEWRGMGTTLVVLRTAGERAVIGHVGDSRAYRMRNGRLERLTSDHSWVAEQVKLGLLSDEEASRHPMRNIVTRALGNRNDVEVELAEEALLPGDTLLLCSDGLNSMLDDDEIHRILAENREPRDACQALVEKANAQGGDDNITVIVARVPEG